MRITAFIVVATFAAVPAVAAAEPYSFLLTPTDQMAVPGEIAGVEITPEGYLFTGHGELVFRLGPNLRAFDQRIRTLQRGRYPIYRSSVRHGRVTYSLETFTTRVAGDPVAFVRVTMRNPTRRSATARWATGIRHAGAKRKPSGAHRFRFLRPANPARAGLYEQPGEGFRPGASYRFRGSSLARDGRVLYVFPEGGRGTRRALRLRPGPKRRPLRPQTVVGLASYSVKLRPGRSASLVFRMPVTPVKAGSARHRRIARASYGRARRGLLAHWRRVFAEAVGVAIPEQKVEDAFYASLANILMARYRDPRGRFVQTVNKLQYHAFWLRDAAVITNALDLAGLHSAAGRNFAFFRTWQQDDGLFISRPGQNDGFGQTLWAVGEHVRRTGDLAFARSWFPAIERAVGWFERARAGDRHGLMPPGDPGDNELVAGHLAGDNFWAAAGLERAILVARAAGQDEAAARWAAVLADFRAALDARVRRTASRSRGRIPPALDRRGGEDWGNLWASYPVETYSAADPLVTATIGYTRRRFREGIATYRRRLLHHYLGFRVFQTELMRGEQQQVVQGLYDSLAHTTATHGGFETGIPAYGGRSVDDNMSPHGWFAAEYVALVRNMLVREDPGGLTIMGALSPSWARPGRAVELRYAPTTAGRLTYRLAFREGGATLSWNAEVVEGTRIRWPVPSWARDFKIDGAEVEGGALTLPARTGTVEVSFRVAGPEASYDRSVASLVRAYRRRGR